MGFDRLVDEELRVEDTFDLGVVGVHRLEFLLLLKVIKQFEVGRVGLSFLLWRGCVAIQFVDELVTEFHSFFGAVLGSFLFRRVHKLTDYFVKHRVFKFSE